MKIHLRILYGADDRYQLVQQTLDICYGYFDSIKLINSGPLELEYKFLNIKEGISIETLNYFFGDLESSRNSFLYDIPTGDYVLWLDADERPSQHLLDNLEKIVEELELSKIYSARFPVWSHEWDENGKQRTENWTYDNSLRFPKNSEDYGYKYKNFINGKTDIGPVPTIGRMVKKIHEFTSSNTNFGGHGNIINYKNNFDMRIVMYPILHYKHDIMIYQSAVTCTYVNPCLNAPIKDGYKEYTKSTEFKKLREFQLKTGVKTQNDLCKKLYLFPDKKFKQEFSKLCSCSEFKNSNLYDNFFKYYYVWAEKYDLSWDTPPIYCGKECCKYKYIQL